MRRIALCAALSLTACHNWDALEKDCTVQNGCIHPNGSGGSGGPTAPAAPTGVMATVTGVRQVHVTWVAPTNNGGSDITGYGVSVATSAPMAPVRTAEVTAGVLEATVDMLENATAYTFVVVARNDYGTSDPSLGSNVVTTPAPPAAPTMVVASPDLNRNATITWVPPPDPPGHPIRSFTVGGTNVTPVTVDAGTALVATFSGLTNGQQYSFSVVATNDVGDGPAGFSLPITPKGVPGTPGSVMATAGNSEAVVTWNAPADTGGTPITQYIVTASTGPAMVITAGGIFTARVTGLTNGIPYRFTVVARNTQGDSVGATSNEVTPAAVPDPPTTVTAVRGAGSAQVSWTAPANNGGSPIIDYTVTSSPNSISALSATTSAMVTGLTNGTSYTFKVTARNANGSSLDSQPSNAVIPADKPNAPTGVTATPGNAQATVQWLPGSNNGDQVIRFTVLAYEGAVVVGTVNTPDGFVTQATVTGLINTTHSYTFTVTATNNIGSSPESSASTSVTPQANLPDQPTNVTAVAGDRQAVVQWFAPSNNGGSAIVNYDVAWSSSAGNGSTTVGNVTMTTVTGLTNGASYRFTVAARNASGTGSASAPSAPVTPDTVPGAPGKPVAVPGNMQVSLTWPAPAVNNGTAITSYTVTPVTGGGNPFNTGSSLTQATVGGLTNGTSYTFTVHATNAAGSGPESPPSDPAIPVTPPASAPTNVIASDGTSPDYVTITWNPVAGATDYKVYRGAMLIATGVPVTTYNDLGATEGAGPSVDQPDASIGNVNESVTTRTLQVTVTWREDAGLAGPAHLYSVAASNGGGDGPTSSTNAGNRGWYPINLREVSLDLGSYQTATTSPYADTTAPAPTITTGATTATDGTLLGQVNVSAPAAQSFTGAFRSYNVRVTNSNNRVSAPTGAATGRRGVGALSYQWQRTDLDMLNATYSPLVTDGGLSQVDITLPADGSGRYYQCVASASGAVPVPSTPARGSVEQLRLLSNFGYSVNGTVNAMVVVPDAGTFIGGDFTRIAPITGSFSVFLNNSTVPTTGPKVDRDVLAIASDGAGGWYVGGNFSVVGGVTRNRLAHITAAGALDLAFDPNPDGDVYALAFASGVLYVGGAFNSIATQARSHIAALDAAGAATAWNPGANDVVRAIAVSTSASGNVYFGGDFTVAQGVTRNRVASAPPDGGVLTTFDPNCNDRVRAIALGTSNIYVGGDFTSVRGGTTRVAVASLTSTNTVNTFDAQLAKAAGAPKVYALAASGSSTVWVGGDYETVRGASAPYIAALDGTGTATTPYAADAPVYAVSLVPGGGNVIYYGGDFITPQNKVAKSLAWNPNLNGPWPVLALAASGTSGAPNIAVGGSFASFGGTTRNRVAGIMLDGGLHAWSPTLNNTVYAMAATSTRLYVGGEFTNSSAYRLAGYSLPNPGNSTVWQPSGDDGTGGLADCDLDGTVYAVATSGTNVFAGGAFQNCNVDLVDGGVDSLNSYRVEAFDVGTGMIQLWSAVRNGTVYSLTPGTNVMYVGGSFTQVVTTSTIRYRAVAFSTVVGGNFGNLQTWNPGFDGGSSQEVRAIAVAGSNVYLGGSFSSVGGQSRANFAAVTTAGAMLPLNPGTNGTVNTITATGNTVFLGGSFTTVGGQPHVGLASVDVAGPVTSWSAGLKGVVMTSSLNPTTLTCGGSFTTIPGSVSADVASFGP